MIPCLMRATLLSELAVEGIPRGIGGPWFEQVPLLVVRQEVAVAKLDGQTYVIGGFVLGGAITNTVEAYDPDSDEWRFVAPFPSPIYHAAAATVDGRLFLMGDWPEFFGTPLDTVYEYDPIRDRWDPKASMPTDRGALAAVVLDGKIYVAGGRSANTVSESKKALEAFELATGRWEMKEPMPTARSGIAGTVVAEHLFVFGGEGNIHHPDGIFDQVEGYDPGTGGWTSFAPMPTPGYGIGAAVIDGCVHIPGGGSVEGFGVTTVHEVFIPEALRGDVDMNGVVNAGDVLAFCDHFGGSEPANAADLDHDGDADFEDLDALLVEVGTVRGDVSTTNGTFDGQMDIVDFGILAGKFQVSTAGAQIGTLEPAIIAWFGAGFSVIVLRRRSFSRPSTPGKG